MTTAYWLGGLANNTGTWGASIGTASNWTTDGGGTATGLVPGATTDVVLSDTSAASGNQAAMSLGVDMSIKSLTVNGTVGTPNNTNPVTLANAGNYTLTIANGITVNSGSGTVTLAAPIALGRRPDLDHQQQQRCRGFGDRQRGLQTDQSRHRRPDAFGAEYLHRRRAT